MSATPRQGLAFWQALTERSQAVFEARRPPERSFPALMSFPAAAAGVSGLFMIGSVPEASAAPAALVIMGLAGAFAAHRPWLPAKAAAAPIQSPPIDAAAEARMPTGTDVPACGAAAALPAAARPACPSSRRRSGAAVADLMARVSHEIRTPLNAVIGFSDVMNAEMYGPVGHPRYREYVTHICDSGRALLKSAEDTLAITSLLAERRAGEPVSAINLADIAGEAWSYYEAEASLRGVGLKTRIPQGLELLSERRPLRQILVNLFGEALTRTYEGSTIEIAARVDGDLAEVSLRIAGTVIPARPEEISLSLSFAETLLELHGAFLIVDCSETDWCVSTVLTCAAQQDFFDTPRVTPAPAAYVC